MSEPNIVSFPTGKRKPKPEGDAAHAANVLKAWRTLRRKIQAARCAGLQVEWEGESSIEPRITRTFR